MEDGVEGIGKGERVLQQNRDIEPFQQFVTMSICTKSCMGKNNILSNKPQFPMPVQQMNL